ncbi:unnamed protein product [Rhizopus microsporus]
MSLVTSRLHVTNVMLAHHLLNPIRQMSHLKKPYLSLNNSKRNMAIVTSLYGNLINNTNDTVNPLIDQDDVTRCCMCHQIFGSHGSSMILSCPSSRNKRILYGKHWKNPKIVAIMNSWIVAGSDDVLCTVVSKSGKRKFDYNSYLSHIITVHNNNFINSNELHRKVKNLHGNMKQRQKKNPKYKNQHEVATVSELEEIIKSSNGRCAVSGAMGAWVHGVTYRELLLTLDHYVPISKGGSFDISNLQPILGCLNRVKSDRSNAELCLWLERFKNSVKIDKIRFY